MPLTHINIIYKMKVWILTEEGYESTSITGVYDSKEKALNIAKQEAEESKQWAALPKGDYEIKDLGSQIVVYFPFYEGSANYRVTEWDIE
jgi:hypothetical protein